MTKRSKSSSRWLAEHEKDPYVKRARKEGLRSRAAFKLEEIQRIEKLIKPGMVIVDLGIPPGFNVDGGDFAEMVAAKKVQKFSVTSRQVTLYLGDVKPGDELMFEYGLKPKYPVKAKTPATVAYEYYTPGNRVESKPVELTVEDNK